MHYTTKLTHMTDWQADIGKKRALDDAMIPIEQHIRQARRVELDKQVEVPSMRTRVSAIDAKISECADHRHRVRRKLDLQKQRQEIMGQIEYIESKKNLSDFDERVAPYLAAYYSQINRANRPKKSKTTVLPGEVSSVVEVSESSSKDVVAEMLTTMSQKPPPLKMERNDICPRCTTAMRMVPAKAVISCTKCGYTASFLDSTTSSISYGEEVDFCSFSYKRINHFNEVTRLPLLLPNPVRSTA